MQTLNNITIYPVLCQKLSLGRSNEQVLKAIIAGGAKIVQYRDKDLTKQDFYKEAKTLRTIAKENNILFTVNDYVDIAKDIDADGVHLGQEDMSIHEARSILGKDKIIGISTHNLEEAKIAIKNDASYINVGPIFATNTKDNVIEPVGIEMFKLIKKHVNIPITVMGGINETNIDNVLEAGADKIAMVSAIVSAKDITQAVKSYCATISNFSIIMDSALNTE